MPFNFILTLKGERNFDYSLTLRDGILIISSPRWGED